MISIKIIKFQFKMFQILLLYTSQINHFKIAMSLDKYIDDSTD